MYAGDRDDEHGERRSRDQRGHGLRTIDATTAPVADLADAELVRRRSATPACTSSRASRSSPQPDRAPSCGRSARSGGPNRRPTTLVRVSTRDSRRARRRECPSALAPTSVYGRTRPASRRVGGTIKRGDRGRAEPDGDRGDAARARSSATLRRSGRHAGLIGFPAEATEHDDTDRRERRRRAATSRRRRPTGRSRGTHRAAR